MLATGVLWHTDLSIPIFSAVALFAGAYLLVALLPILCWAPRGLGYAVAAGLLAMVAVAVRPERACLIAVPTYLVAWAGLRYSLAQLFNETENGDETWLAQYIEHNMTARSEHVPAGPLEGWPFGYLSPKPPAAGLPPFDAVCLSLLAGWAMYCVSTLIIDPLLQFRAGSVDFWLMRVIATGVSYAVVVFRLAAYCGPYRPPIAFLGRLTTGRLIIPRYDVVLAAPIGAVVLLHTLQPGWLDTLHVPLRMGDSASRSRSS